MAIEKGCAWTYGSVAALDALLVDSPDAVDRLLTEGLQRLEASHPGMVRVGAPEQVYERDYDPGRLARITLTCRYDTSNCVPAD